MLATLMMLLMAVPVHADCLKVDTKDMKEFMHQGKKYYTDAGNNYLLAVGCIKADASAAEVKTSLQKSGTIENLSESRIAHTIQADGAVALSVFDFGAENGQVTAVSKKLTPADLKKALLSRLK